MATEQLSLQLRAERARLGGQCALILGMLQTGRRTNTDLSRHALKYGGRISELRKKGHDVRVVERNYETGLTVYALFVDGQEVPR
ncbi:MAG: hypothetical protein A2Y61_05375 [Chloroflexi bacterium RBG_13_60_13]|nr:MAG: hypothetical protein A2Y61_05375 [Chloroflexi bacterium RBG_13_60_13]